MNKHIGVALITFTTSMLLAGVTGYGVFNYTLGEIKTKLNEHDMMFASRSKYIEELQVVKSDVTLVKHTLDSYRLLLIDWRKEQREVSSEILDKITHTAEQTIVNRHNIALIQKDIKTLAEKGGN